MHAVDDMMLNQWQCYGPYHPQLVTLRHATEVTHWCCSTHLWCERKTHSVTAAATAAGPLPTDSSSKQAAAGLLLPAWHHCCKKTKPASKPKPARLSPPLLLLAMRWPPMVQRTPGLVHAPAWQSLDLVDHAVDGKDQDSCQVVRDPMCDGGPLVALVRSAISEHVVVVDGLRKKVQPLQLPATAGVQTQRAPGQSTHRAHHMSARRSYTPGARNVTASPFALESC